MSQSLPQVIQGGMGVGISNWRLARAVSLYGQLGVVSGTGVDVLFARQLQDGDRGGELRRAASAFPIPGIAQRVVDHYFLPGGRGPTAPYRAVPMYSHRTGAERQQLSMVAAFVEVFLAKEGHDRPVGMNLLTKVQLPTLPTLYGAMLAGVDVVIMGAGIPREIPGALDRLAGHDRAALRLEMIGARGAAPEMLEFDPRDHWPDRTLPAHQLTRPRFLAIVAADSLATMLARKANGRVDGFVVEGPRAGGHNAPPRGEPRSNERGEPLYGERDLVDLEVMRGLGVPFWLAGGVGSPMGLRSALEAGAAGIQVGTLFAFCEESGLRRDIRTQLLEAARDGRVSVRTDPRASPTGYPFKVVEVDGRPFGARDRERVCDMGYLRTIYRRPNGSIGYRCPGEPVGDYVAKGGAVEETEGRRCLCNALLANAGYGQVRAGAAVEPPLVTSGDDLETIAAFLGCRSRYTAEDVLDYLLSFAPAGAT